MSEKTFEVWVTKYALSVGIKKFLVEDNFDISPEMVTCSHESFFKGQWHTEFDLAKAKAEEMRDRKISSLKKQIAKLENTDFAKQRNNQ